MTIKSLIKLTSCESVRFAIICECDNKKIINSLKKLP